MKFDEALKLENFKAHYQVILGNIDISNKELGILLEQQIATKKNLEDSQELLKANKMELEEILAHKSDAEKQIEDRLKFAYDKETEASSKKEEADKYYSDKKSEADTYVAKANDQIVSLAANVGELQSQESTLNDSLYLLTGQAKSLSGDVSTLTGTVNSLKRQQAELITSIETSSIEHKNQIDLANKELEELGVKIEESRAKVLDFDEHVKTQEKNMARRESDIMVITERLKKAYQTVYPGIGLKI